MDKLYKVYGEVGLLVKKVKSYHDHDGYNITVCKVVEGNHRYKQGEKLSFTGGLIEVS